MEIKKEALILVKNPTCIPLLNGILKSNPNIKIHPDEDGTVTVVTLNDKNETYKTQTAKIAAFLHLNVNNTALTT